jgi:hypothetical protein
MARFLHFWRLMYSVLSDMKLLRGQLLLAMGALVWLTGCASIGPPVPPSLELPHPPSDLRAARKGDKVTLTWTVPARTTDRQSVRYLGQTRVCRSLDASLKQCEAPVGEAAPPADFAKARRSAQKVTASFTDTLAGAIQQATPKGFATYAVEVLNSADRGAGISNQVRVALVPTIPPFGSFAGQATAQGVLISWQCPPQGGRRTDAKYLFRIYRHSEAVPRETKLADTDATDCVAGPSGLAPLSDPASNPAPNESEKNEPREQNKNPHSFLDQTIEWENTYFYQGTVVSVVQTAGKSAVEVEGDDTPEVKVFAHDVFPPAVPSGLQAVFSGPGQQAFIDLIWAPVTDTDLDGYNIYRHEDSGAAVMINSEPVRTPAFRDMQVVSGKKYFYSVSAVDQRGNESARSEEAGESVP